MGVRNSARRGVGSGSMRRRHLMPVCTAVGLLIAMLPALLPVSSANAATATLTVTSPTQNQILSSGSVTVTGTSTLAGTIKVTFDSQNPAVTASTSGTAPNVTWSATKSLADGTHTAVADLSGGGNSGTSPTRTFKVDTTNPTISITSPTSPATTSDTTPTISGTVGDANLDTVKINGTGPGGATFGPTLATVTGGTSWSVDTPTLSEGSWSITATATDLATPTAHSTTSSAATVVVDTTNPTVAITSPADGSSTSDDTPTISGTVSDLNLQKVEVSGTGPGGATYGPTQATVTGGTTWSLDTTSLVDGSWTFTAKATDKAGNNTTTTAVTITVDAPPNTTIDSGPGSTTDGTADFTFSSNDAAATFECKLDGPGATTGSFSTCTSPKSYPGLADGSYTFSVRATDASNNTDASPDTKTFTVDNTAPNTTILTGPGNTFGGTAAFTFSSNEAGSTFECKLDGPGATTGTFTACTSPKSYPGLVDGGSYTFSVRATDTAGNTDASPATQAFTVVIDVTAPDTTIDSGPGATNDGIADFTFSANEAGSTFKCKLDGPGATTGTFAPCTQGGNPTGTKSYTGLAEGSYTFSVQATDVAGNTDASPATTTFTVDKTPPNTTIDTGPGTTNDGIADFTFSSTEPTGATFECKLDGPGIFITGTYSACTSPKSYPGLADGDYTFSVRATDTAGNTDASSATQAFTVDATAPDTTINSGPGNITDGIADFTFSSEAGATFECKLDGPGAATGTFASCTSPQSYPSLAEGDYTFSVRATDTAGNTDATPDTKTFTVDTTAPDTTIDAGPGSTTDGTADFSFSSSEPTDATFECKLDGPGATTGSFEACNSGSKSYPSLADGDYTFSVQATDAAGNTDATPDTKTFTVDNTFPETTIDNGPGSTADGTADFAFSSDDATATFECKLDGPGAATGTFASCTSPQSYSSLADGDYTFSVQATDTANNTDATPDTKAFTVDNTAPDTTIDSGPGSTTDGTADFAFSSNEAGSTFECKLDGPGATTGSFASCTSPQSYPSLADGDYTFSVKATDTAGNTDASPDTKAFTVDNTFPETTIDSGPGSTADGTADFAFSSDDATATFECKLDGPGAATGTFASCTSPQSYPSLADGDYTFSVQATDPANNTDATPDTKAFTVDNTAPTTTIDSGPGSTADGTADFAFSSNEAGSTFECKLDGPGATTGTFDSCTSPQSYPGLADGSYTFSVRATDTSNNTDASPATQAFTVDNTAPDTTIDTGPGSTTDGTADFTFSSNEAGTFECKLDGPGATTGTFATCTSPKSYPSLADGNYTFSVRAKDTAGNTDASPATQAFAVDNSAPNTTIDSGPGSTSDGIADFAFSSNEAGSTFQCQLVGPGHAAGFSTCTSPQSYSSLADGSYTFSVRATDTSNNTDASPATQAFTVDNTAPDTTINSGPGTTSDGTADFTFSSNEPGTFECKLDGPGAATGTFTTCASPKSYAGLTDGSYTFSVQAIDAANNPDASPATNAFTVTVAPPITTTCNGRTATIEGTDAAQEIDGTPGSDVIVGLGGNDIIYAGGGNDVICGGTGDDKIYGEDGNDSLLGEAGNDYFDGGTGADKISGGDGTNDRINYAEHTTSVLVTIGNGKADDGNYTDGPSTARDDVFSNVEGVTGGPGNDKLIGTDAANTLDGAGGDDTLQGLGGNDTLVGNAGGDFLYGGYGRDSVIGGTGVDALYGEADGDYLYAQDNTKDARIDGGTGTDKAYRDSIDPAPISVP
jgi:hypothetical protein